MSQEWEQEFYRCYPDLRILFICTCGRQGTIYAYGSGIEQEQILGGDGKQLTDKQGNPRTTEKSVLVCRSCGSTKQTQSMR
jgi:hypothetical protein